VWWLWPQKCILSDSEYDIALALYRVCNQSSEDGLARIEILLFESERADSDGQSPQLKAIIAQAKAGKWKDAAKACRRILDDQVKPTTGS
jgi:hypothetical protein